MYRCAKQSSEPGADKPGAKADELSGACRSFYDWLHGWAKKRKAFSGADVRKDLRIHPRTLNRYLGELSSYGMLRITGGNAGRKGYSYMVEGAPGLELQAKLETQITQVIMGVREAAALRVTTPQPKPTAVRRRKDPPSSEERIGQ